MGRPKGSVNKKTTPKVVNDTEVPVETVSQESFNVFSEDGELIRTYPTREEAEALVRKRLESYNQIVTIQ